MDKKLMECFVNPIKCKILLEIHAIGRATAKQLVEALQEIPQATLYRYLNKMLKDNVLNVVEERKVRAIVEKVYAVTLDFGKETQKLLEQNSGEAYMQLFTQYMMGLMREFQDYSTRPDIDILNDGSGFSVGPVYASSEELEEAVKSIGKTLAPLRTNPASAERKMRSIGLIITPPKL